MSSKFAELRGLLSKSASEKTTFYTDPVIKNSGGSLDKQWYVEFYYTDKSIRPEPKRYRIKQGINRHKSVEKRMAAARLLQTLVLELLRDGYNPLRNSSEYDTEVRETSVLTLIEKALSLFKTATDRSRSHQSYKDAANKLIKYIKEKDGDIGINQLRKRYIVLFRDQLLTTGITNRTANNVITALSGLFSHLATRDEIEFNPFHGIPPLRQTETLKEDWTPEEIQTIKHATKKCKSLWICCQLIYYCGIRPAEICRLTVGDVKLDQKVILVQGANSKNRKATYVNIPDGFIDELREYIGNAPKEHYLISVYQWKFVDAPGTGAKKSSRNRLSEKFKAVVKVPYGINKDMYWLKDTAETRLLMLGVDAQAVAKHYRHHSVDQTMSYATNFKLSENHSIKKDFPSI